VAQKESAGILLYRKTPQGRLEVLLVHPGGPFWAGRDAGAWSIPKGEPAAGEEPLKAALREFSEETGARPPEGPYLPLAPIRLKSGKVVQAWAAQGDFDPAALRSNTFRLEWPPRSGRFQDFPEVGRAAWFALPRAKEKANPAYGPMLDELAALMGG